MNNKSLIVAVGVIVLVGALSFYMYSNSTQAVAQSPTPSIVQKTTSSEQSIEVTRDVIQDVKPTKEQQSYTDNFLGIQTNVSNSTVLVFKFDNSGADTLNFEMVNAEITTNGNKYIAKGYSQIMPSAVLNTSSTTSIAQGESELIFVSFNKIDDLSNADFKADVVEHDYTTQNTVSGKQLDISLANAPSITGANVLNNNFRYAENDEGNFPRIDWE